MKSLGELYKKFGRIQFGIVNRYGDERMVDVSSPVYVATIILVILKLLFGWPESWFIVLVPVILLYGVTFTMVLFMLLNNSLRK